MDEMLTTEQAAEQLGVTAQRVRAMVKAGRLPASRFGKSIVIRQQDLKPIMDRKPGRPKSLLKYRGR
jgi:excisionase family DNA binding protein